MGVPELRRRVLERPARHRPMHHLPAATRPGPRRRRRMHAMTCGATAVASLSIWDPIHLGTDETGKHVYVNLAERNMLIGGEPGSGKSVALQLIVAHAAISADVRLILIDGTRVELGLWAACADRFVGPSIDDAIEVMHWLQ